MKIPVRFKKLSESNIDDIKRYFNVFGEIRFIGETDSYTTLYYYPNNISSVHKDLRVIKETLKFVGYREELIED